MKKKIRLQAENITLEELFESMPVAMVLLDREGRHIALNQKLASISGRQSKDLIGRKVHELSEESGENSKRDFQLFDAGEEIPDHEVVIGRQTFHVSTKPVRNKTGFAIGQMVALTDITKNKETERELAEANGKLQFLADHDALTGVLNSRAYYEMCERMILLSHRNRTDFSVLVVDLDHFKNINDTYGHDVGDLVLKTASQCMVQGSRGSDIVGRIGGEEFSVYLPETNGDGAVRVAEKLRQKIEALAISIGSITLNVTASIGVAVRSECHRTIADIQRDADRAMYHSKRTGRNKVTLLNPLIEEQGMHD